VIAWVGVAGAVAAPAAHGAAVRREPWLNRSLPADTRTALIERQLPAPIALAATWDPAVAYSDRQLIGRVTRAASFDSRSGAT